MESDTQNWASERREKIRPWSEVIDKTRFTKPASLAEVKERAAKNWEHFASNYIIVGFCLSLLLVFWRLAMIIYIALSVAGFFTIFHKMSSSLIIAGVEMKPPQAAMVWGVLSLLLLFFGSSGNSFFYVLLLAVILIGGHAAIYEQQQPDNMGEKV